MLNMIRVLIAKPGLDGHDRGAKVVARALRDAGFEVIYTGLHQTPEMVVNAAIQEDVDVVGLSILSGAHLPLVTAIQKLMVKEGVRKPIFVGGIIPEHDVRALTKQGVAAVFGPGASLNEIATRVREVVTAHATPSVKATAKKSFSKASIKRLAKKAKVTSKKKKTSP